MKKPISPLRKIVGWAVLPLEGTHTEIEHEVYECGHVGLQKQDIYGHTNAMSRRCAKCRLGKPPRLSVDEVEKIRIKYLGHPAIYNNQ